MMVLFVVSRFSYNLLHEVSIVWDVAHQKKVMILLLHPSTCTVIYMVYRYGICFNLVFEVQHLVKEIYFCRTMMRAAMPVSGSCIHLLQTRV